MSTTGHFLQLALSGSRPAIDELFRRHRGRLLAFFSASTSTALARRVPPEDLVQETLLTAARRLHEFRPEGEHSFYAWLVGIARHKLSEAQRSEFAEKRARVASLDHDPSGRATSPSFAALRADQTERIRMAIASLPDAQATALRLRYLEGCTTAQVATAMGKSEAAIKALVVRAFAELAERLDESAI